MAIAFDASSHSRTSSATSQQHAHTCTGSNRGLMVCVIGAGSDLITGATYNGVAMTLVAKLLLGSARWGYLFWLAAPASGANNIVVSASTSSFIEINAVSYTGVSQTGQPEAYATDAGTGAANTRSPAVTTVTDNAWVVGLAYGNAGSITAGASTAVRSNDLIGGAMDSNAAVSPAASRALNFTQASSSEIGAIVAAVAPASGGGGGGSSDPRLNNHPLARSLGRSTFGIRR